MHFPRRFFRGILSESRFSFERRLQALLSLVNKDSQPNINALWRVTRDLELQAFNQKFFGYELARRLAAALPIRNDLNPRRVELRSKPSTQVDLESDWAAYWCSQLKTPVVFHRKLWELVYVLQAIFEHGHLQAGARGLGFGCGQEPLPSYLASHDVKVTVTDLSPEDQRARGWASTNQHLDSLNKAFRPDLVNRKQFDSNTQLKFMDMNAIDRDLRDYDFCWSICALEHLGSIKNGTDFIVNSLETLRPGGLAVHTTEFNFLNDKETIDNWVTVLYQRQHFIALAERLRCAGHSVADLDFDVGNKALDKFIDIPPYIQDWSDVMRQQWSEGASHLKLAIDGFAATCFGLIIMKSP